MLHRHCRVFALLAYKYEAGKDILEHAEEIAQLPTSLHQVHEYLKIETGKKEQEIFGVRVPTWIFCYREEIVWVYWDSLIYTRRANSTFKYFPSGLCKYHRHTICHTVSNNIGYI